MRILIGGETDMIIRIRIRIFERKKNVEGRGSRKTRKEGRKDMVIEREEAKECVRG